MKAKVCLVGEGMVGKTSLIRRYVYDEFDDRYKTTLGAKITKKDMIAQDSEGERYDVTLSIWDIMGSDSVRNLMKEVYFEGARGILAVCDVTRPETLEALGGWIEAIRHVTGDIPVLIVANKVDLQEEEPGITDDLLSHAGTQFDVDNVFLTSARTGENVSRVFLRLGRLVVS